MRIIPMKRTFEVRSILLAVLLLLAMSGLVIGQEVAGVINGTIKDSVGLSVSGATINHRCRKKLS